MYLHYMIITAGVANIKFQQRDGEIQLIAVPRLDTNGENHKQEEPRNSHANLGEFERECGPPGREGAVVGEVEALSQSHPIVRLDFFKTTDGFSHNKHEEIIKESSKSPAICIYVPHVHICATAVWLSN